MHHAYFYFGSLAQLEELAEAARSLFDFKKANDPDVRVLEVEKFGIDEARELKDQAMLRSVSGRSLYIVGVSTITSEAQQALLKLFEEPQAGAVFVLLAPHGSLIATLHSRMLPFPAELDEAGKHAAAKAFIAAAPKARSDAITKMLKDDEGARETVREFLNGLEIELHKGLKKSKGSKEYIEALDDIAKVRSYVGDRSPSLKMLLEHLALSVLQQ